MSPSPTSFVMSRARDESRHDGAVSHSHSCTLTRFSHSLRAVKATGISSEIVGPSDHLVEERSAGLSFDGVLEVISK